MTTAESHRTNTKSRLLEAALTLFWHSSYGSVSVDDICKKAGVHKGSFYHFFDSKVTLTIAAFETFWESKRPVLDEAFALSLSPVERIKRYSSLIYHWQKEEFDKTGKVLGCPFAGCGAELSTQEEDFRLAIENIFTGYSEYFERLVKDAGICPPEMVHLIAQEMIAYVEGVIQQAKFSNDLNIIKTLLLPGMLQYISPEAALKARFAAMSETTP
jgi:TetR/AcrR family transcriptional repressor of nem operon